MPCASGKTGVNGKCCPFIEYSLDNEQALQAWSILEETGFNSIEDAMALMELNGCKNSVVYDFIQSGLRGAKDGRKDDS